ncbi:WXG100 family type VII secretion target [Pseudactinotalea sp. HY158]|uniref:WXG100 family type VII secretion target n=2 Tax=unclassified Pseudactinotalea TaxID=2649176 RepID=UPI001E33B794|nr:WXG100 family type VII secretion target [Pseudactinotalea sp. HY158]
MMARFEVDSAEVARGALAARHHGGTIRAEVATMMQLLLSLEASWQGSASLAFREAIQQWRLTQQQVESSLDALSASLDVSARQYDDAESANTRMFLH